MASFFVKQKCNFGLSVLMMLILVFFVEHNKSPHQYYLINVKVSLNLWANLNGLTTTNIE